MYNDMGMTGITGITMDIQVLHFQCPIIQNVYKSYTVIVFLFFWGGGGSRNAPSPARAKFRCRGGVVQ